MNNYQSPIIRAKIIFNFTGTLQTGSPPPSTESPQTQIPDCTGTDGCPGFTQGFGCDINPNFFMRTTIPDANCDNDPFIDFACEIQVNGQTLTNCFVTSKSGCTQCDSSAVYTLVCPEQCADQGATVQIVCQNGQSGPCDDAF